ncbi:MAG: mechanosensitive ion channel family protein [Oscillospiraceae bacterium]|nr:mechanosensitive ion channel family protein [Oscillospiraceae bacterium]
MKLEELMHYQIGPLSAGNLLTALLLLGVCLGGAKLVMKLVDRMLRKLQVEKSLHHFIRSAAKFALLFLTALIVADSLGIPVTSLVTVLGVVGLAVSLAVQDSLAKLAGGLMVLAAKPFVVGDYVDVGTVSGTVQEIGLIYTCLSTPDNKVVYLPNNDVAGARVTNFSARATRRVDLMVCASYGDDTQTVKTALRQALEAAGGVLEDPPPFIGVSEYQDSSVQYVIRAWVKTADYWDVYYSLLEQVRRTFTENGVQMSYPHLNVHLMENGRRNKDEGLDRPQGRKGKK